MMELVVMTFIRCLALLHCYYHFKKVHRVGSSLIMKITLAYLSFTMILYSLVVFGLYGPEFENVKESWFLIMLFTDIPKVTRMAQFALTSSHQRRIPANVAVGKLFPTY
jgi:hydroxymethylglutaryl-CoA reductase (NADPH)